METGEAMNAADNNSVNRKLSPVSTTSSASIKFPLFEGFGTHYVYLYVGHPNKQRVSVIVDTGSHHTAFPCKGCKCGKHMNPFYNPKLSNSSNVATCRGNLNRCRFSQSYSEGSSWTAYKVQDKVHMGGLTEKSITHSDTLSIPFDFGCQEEETGLFRTQHEDGIMGFSAREDTFPFQLKRKNIIPSNVFSMCFRPRGGYLTLPSPVTTLHTTTSSSTVSSSNNHQLINKNHHNNINLPPMTYIPLVKSIGWYTVRLVDILMYVPSIPTLISSSSSSLATTSSSSSSSSMKLLSVSKPLKSTYAAYEMNTRSMSSDSNSMHTINSGDRNNNNNNNNLRGSNINIIQKISIGASESVYNGGKGTIIDSGTTDTYLPAAIKSQFEKVFFKLSQGVSYTNNRIVLTENQFNLLPVIVYRFHNKYSPSEFIDIETYPSSYAQKMKSTKINNNNNNNNGNNHKVNGNNNNGNQNNNNNQNENEYTFRIYLSESVGAVLGSNFMNYHHIEFDIDRMQVGIQPDSCHFEKSSGSAVSSLNIDKHHNNRKQRKNLEDETNFENENGLNDSNNEVIYRSSNSRSSSSSGRSSSSSSGGSSSSNRSSSSSNRSSSSSRGSGRSSSSSSGSSSSSNNSNSNKYNNKYNDNEILTYDNNNNNNNNNNSYDDDYDDDDGDDDVDDGDEEEEDLLTAEAYEEAVDRYREYSRYYRRKLMIEDNNNNTEIRHHLYNNYNDANNNDSSYNNCSNDNSDKSDNSTNSNYNNNNNNNSNIDITNTDAYTPNNSYVVKNNRHSNSQYMYSTYNNNSLLNYISGCNNTQLPPQGIFPHSLGTTLGTTTTFYCSNNNMLMIFILCILFVIWSRMIH